MKWLGLAAALAALVLAHVVLLVPPTVTLSGAYDEGYIQAFAVRMLDGHMLPYVDAVSHRGPVLYWVAALAVALGDPQSFLQLRLLILAIDVLSVLLVFTIPRLYGRAAAGGVAALLYVFLLLFVSRADGIQLNGEPLQDLFLLAATAALAWTLRPGRERICRRAVAAAGFCAALAVLTRQTAAVAVVPMALWLLAVSAHRDPAHRFRPLALFVAAALVPRGRGRGALRRCRRAANAHLLFLHL